MPQYEMLVVGIPCTINGTGNVQKIEQGAKLCKSVIGFQERIHVQECLTWRKIFLEQHVHNRKGRKHQLSGSDDLGSGGRIIQGRKKVVIGSGDKSYFVLVVQLHPKVTSKREHIVSEFY